MADDIFLSPEEQDERARQWLKDNGPALVIGIALGLAAIFGYDLYKNNKITMAEQASALYSTALEEMSDSELSNIDAQVSKLKADFASSSYASKAALLKAKQLSVSDLDAAYTELQWVVDNAKEVGLKQAAQIRQIKIKISQGDFTAAKVLASQPSVSGFESNYAELMAEISLKQGDESAAREHYQKAIDALPVDQAAYKGVLSLKLERLPDAVEPAVESKVSPIDAAETDGNTVKKSS